MPTDYTIDVQRGVVLSAGTGVFASADFVEHMVRLRGDPNFNPDFNQVVDCRGISVLDLNSDQLKELASQSIFSAKSRRAFVVSSDLHFGMGRMFAAYREIAEGQNVRIFRDMSEALSWLELPADLDFHAAEKSSPRFRAESVTADSTPNRGSSSAPRGPKA